MSAQSLMFIHQTAEGQTEWTSDVISGACQPADTTDVDTDMKNSDTRPVDFPTALILSGSAALDFGHIDSL